MWSNARQVAAGDTVIIWLTRDQVQPLVVTPGKDFNTKFGNFRQQDFVGVPYGSKVPSRSGRGFVHILRPTPELWTVALPHRTQILYLADIAFITAHLNIRPGSKVIEAGTGSASFSHSVSRTIGSSGHLYSYEFHEARYIKAKEEFTRHGMDDTVTLQHRNVCKDGFAVENAVDSVFLDLPAPWEAVEHAKKALRKDRVTRICCFSPCMEQVLRTVSALNEAGFTEITMHETLLRPIEVFQTPALQSIAGVAEKLKRSEVRREEKRLRQIAANRAAMEGAAAGAGGGAGVKRKREEGGEGEGEGDAGGRMDADEDADEDAENGAMGGEEPESTIAHKKIKTANTITTSSSISISASSSSSKLTTAKTTATTIKEEDADVEMADADTTPSATPPAPTPAPTKMNVSKALPEVRGHTSYLTFACLAPNPRSIAARATASANTTTTANTNTSTKSNPDTPTNLVAAAADASTNTSVPAPSASASPADPSSAVHPKTEELEASST